MIQLRKIQTKKLEQILEEYKIKKTHLIKPDEDLNYKIEIIERELKQRSEKSVVSKDSSLDSLVAELRDANEERVSLKKKNILLMKEIERYKEVFVKVESSIDELDDLRKKQESQILQLRRENKIIKIELERYKKVFFDEDLKDASYDLAKNELNSSFFSTLERAKNLSDEYQSMSRRGGKLAKKLSTLNNKSGKRKEQVDKIEGMANLLSGAELSSEKRERLNKILFSIAEDIGIGWKGDERSSLLEKDPQNLKEKGNLLHLSKAVIFYGTVNDIHKQLKGEKCNFTKSRLGQLITPLKNSLIGDISVLTQGNVKVNPGFEVVANDAYKSFLSYVKPSKNITM